MTSQLEEGSKRELAAALEENGHLMTELNQLRSDLQQQVEQGIRGGRCQGVYAERGEGTSLMW